jgi:hypothetical protein
MLDGRPWPSTWSIDPADLDMTRRAAPWMSVATPAEIGATHAGAIEIVEAWLGTPGLLGAKRGVIAIEPPASAEVIAAFEQAQAFDLPPAYRDLLLLADGIEIGSIVVLGTSDAYRLDIPGPNRLVIGAPDEEGAVVLAPSGEVRFVALGDPTSEGRLRAPDLRAWVRTRASSR